MSSVSGVMWLYMKPAGFCQLCEESAVFSMPGLHGKGKPATFSSHGRTAGAHQSPEDCAHARECPETLRTRRVTLASEQL